MPLSSRRWRWRLLKEAANGSRLPLKSTGSSDFVCSVASRHRKPLLGFVTVGKTPLVLAKLIAGQNQGFLSEERPMASPLAWDQDNCLQELRKGNSVLLSSYQTSGSTSS